MGKNWKGHGGGKGGGGGGGGHGNDFASCRGHGVIIGTCDAARERETSKELVNLLTQTIDALYPQTNSAVDESEEEEGEIRVESIQDMLKNEINQIRNQKNTQTQAVMSVNTGVKGIVLIKIARKDICPVALIKSVFDQVKREKLPVTRFVVRVIPLKLCCFPNEDELNESLKLMIDKSISLNEEGKCVIDEHVPTAAFKLTSKQQWKPPKSAEGSSAASTSDPSPTEEVKNETEEGEVEDEQVNKKARSDNAEVHVASEVTSDVVAPVVVEVPTPAVVEVPTPAVPIQLTYTISFKARNHNTLTKDMLFKAAIRQMPKYARNDYRRPELVVMVEAIKNLCCITIIKGYEDYMEFNLRKFQTVYCGESTSGKPAASGTAVTATEAEAAGQIADEK